MLCDVRDVALFVNKLTYDCIFTPQLEYRIVLVGRMKCISAAKRPARGFEGVITVYVEINIPSILPNVSCWISVKRIIDHKSWFKVVL